MSELALSLKVPLEKFILTKFEVSSVLAWKSMQKLGFSVAD